MSFADGTLKKGLFENNVFIEEIIDEDEMEDENSILVEAKRNRKEKDSSAAPPKRKKSKKPPTQEINKRKNDINQEDLAQQNLYNQEPHTSLMPLPKIKHIKNQPSETA